MTRLTQANWVAFAVPAALLAGALGSQYLGGLYPCEMCHWQRWPHYAALALALGAFVVGDGTRRTLVILAALAIAASGLLGIFHAGVEYGWWRGITSCSTTPTGSLDAILKTPMISCTTPQWTLGPVSLAGFNALFSLGGAASVLWLLGKRGAVA